MTNKNVAASAPVHRLVGRIQEYLGNGGLFNPELMDHEKVRDLLMDVLVHLSSPNAKTSGPTADTASTPGVGGSAASPC
jgi:hypothetical protein